METDKDLEDVRNMESLISRYLQSQKGSTEYAESRMMMIRIRDYNADNNNEEKKLALRKLFLSRLVLNKVANVYAKALGLYQLPDIEDWDAREGRHSTIFDRQTFEKFTRLITDSRVFCIFDGDRIGYSYRRTAQYLAAGMGAAGYQEAELLATMERLNEVKTRHELIGLAARCCLNSTESEEAVNTLSEILREDWM